ncbi:MAG: hypothetical protein K8R53_06135 [Bacteroidales bacterium]|nr:hypothetical protein [Bacteroidales bacterium]
MLNKYPQLGTLEHQFNDGMENKILNPREIWATKISKNFLQERYIDWIMGLGDWNIFLTLTFRNSKYFDVSIGWWKKLVKELNKDLVGNHYSRKVGHSYFSYVLGIEKQVRGDYHFHVLIDRPIHFKLLHEYWGRECGFLKTEIIRKKEHAVQYITKYICKGGVLEPYVQKNKYYPTITPYWWKFDLLQDFLFDGVDASGH